METAARFKYAPNKLRNAIATATGLTLMCALVVWMLSTILGSQYALQLAATSFLLFLAFFSLRMGVIGMGNEPVLAIMPSGVVDRRFPDWVGDHHIEWAKVRHIELRVIEDAAILMLMLWPNREQPLQLPVDLSELDCDPQQVVEAISKYQQVEVVW